MAANRTQTRTQFDATTRISLLETDVDEMEEGIRELVAELKRLRITISSFFIALATAAVLLGLNLAVRV